VGYFVPRTVTVPQGATLNIAAGQVLKLERSITVQGTLTAQGTAAQPVIFTSVYDDTVGGHTLNDGFAGGPHPGDWNQILFTSTSTGDVLDHVDVRYGGAYVEGAVEADTAAPTINNSTISDAFNFGLRLKGSNATLTGDTFQNNRFNQYDAPFGAIRMDVF